MPAFIDSEISVGFRNSPQKSKMPGCPDWFEWKEQRFEVVKMVAAWDDLRRRGRMARNMSDAHSARATHRGSWGVGRFFYRLVTQEGRCFDVYYDRAPQGVDDREGKWFLLSERNGENEI